MNGDFFFLFFSELSRIKASCPAFWMLNLISLLSAVATRLITVCVVSRVPSNRDALGEKHLQYFSRLFCPLLISVNEGQAWLTEEDTDVPLRL